MAFRSKAWYRRIISKKVLLVAFVDVNIALAACSKCSVCNVELIR